MTAKPGHRKSVDDLVTGSEKGFVLGVDYIGPYSPDVDGNIWGFVGVEVAHTQYGFVDLTTDKEGERLIAHLGSALPSPSNHPPTP